LSTESNNPENSIIVHHPIKNSNKTTKAIKRCSTSGAQKTHKYGTNTHTHNEPFSSNTCTSAFDIARYKVYGAVTKMRFVCRKVNNRSKKYDSGTFCLAQDSI
jgi:hypothetical protein